MKHPSYGLPYCGSKTSIVDWLFANIPPAEYFVDLFCGGGSVTHAAMLSGNYTHFIMNDRLPTAQYFIDCINGGCNLEEPRAFVNKETFNRLKTEDMCVRLCYSFSNNGVDYCYSKAVAPYKEVLHKTIFGTGNAAELAEILKQSVYLPPSAVEPAYRWAMIKEQLPAEKLKNTPMKELRLPHYERLCRCAALQKLKPVLDAYPVDTYCKDYTEIEIPDNAVVYCDIPYQNTRQTAYGKFDHARFVEWLQEVRKHHKIYISEYNPPVPDCKCIAETSRFVTCNYYEHKHMTEYLYLID